MIASWEPKEDITAYELALLIPLVTFRANWAADRVKAEFDNLPPEAQRHIHIDGR